MGKARVSTEEFIRIWRDSSGPSEVARRIGVDVRNVYGRRDRLEREGIALPSHRAAERRTASSFMARRNFEIKDGHAIVFSDAHYWPGDPSIAHLALLELCKEFKPKLIVANGDVLDGVTISRHEPRGWQYAPTVQDEIDVVKLRLGEVRQASPKSELMRTLGNHCIRFERHLAVHAPEYRGVNGTSLEHHIPEWPCSWSVEVNNVIVKHRWAGGIHATYNNTLKSGRSIITGHLHSLNVRPYTDYNGTRFGVDTGTLADPEHDAFDYTEDNPKDWRSGFMVLTFRKGVLLWPEACYVDKGIAYFRGEPIA